MSITPYRNTALGRAINDNNIMRYVNPFLAAQDIVNTARAYYQPVKRARELITPAPGKRLRGGGRSVKRKREFKPSPAPSLSRQAAQGNSGSSYMPYRRRYRRGRRRGFRTRRRVYRKRRSMRRPLVRRRAHGPLRLGNARRFGSQGMPPRALVKHTYYHKYTLGQDTAFVPFADVGETNRCKFMYIRLNDIHIPLGGSFQNTATGQAGTLNYESCRNTDIFSQFYKTYRVYKMRLTLVINYKPPNNDSTAQDMICAIRPVSSVDGSYVHPSSFLSLRERGWMVRKVPMNKKTKISIEFSITAVERMNKILFNADTNYEGSGQTEGNTFGSPTTIPHCAIFFYTSDETGYPTETDHCRVETYLTYKTLWKDRAIQLGEQDVDDAIDNATV